MHRQTRTYDSRCAKDASHQVARQETGGRTHTRTPKSFVRYSGKMGRRTDRTSERADREREARSNILMTKYEMTFGFGGGKAGTKQRTSTRWRGTLNSRRARRGPFMGPQLTEWARTDDDDETKMSTPPPPPPRNVLISLCYLLRQLKRRRS